MAAHPPMVWTRDQFKTQTNPSNILRRGRGNKLKAIDTALDNFATAAFPNQKIATLAALLVAIRTWWRAKDAKNVVIASTGLPKPDKSDVAFRRPRVMQLANQVFARLQYETFERRKQNAGAVPGGLRPLQGGYANERQTYLNSGKTQAASGSTAHALVHPPVAGAFDLPHNPAPTTLNFDTMTDVQFQQLVNTFGPPNFFQSEVLFLSKQNRMRHVILVENGLLYSGPMTLYDTSNAANGFAYAVDQYGDLISGDDGNHGIGGQLQAHQRFNHSTFNAGKDVISAGIIKVVQGRLTYLDNNSGHYKPTRTNLVNALTILQNLGVDLTNVQAACKESSMAHRGAIRFHVHNSAALFVTTPNRRPDQIL